MIIDCPRQCACHSLLKENVNTPTGLQASCYESKPAITSLVLGVDDDNKFILNVVLPTIS
jgi:hypothetical protein